VQSFHTLRAAPLPVLLLAAALLAAPSAAYAIGWTPLGPEVGQQAPAVAAAPGSSAVVYAATAAGLYRREGDGPWQAALSGVPRDARANRLAVSPADPNRVVCLGPCGAPLVSDDGGRHWVARGDQFHPLEALLRPFEALALHPDDPDVLYVGGIGGIFRSTDGGRSFEPSYDGILETPVEFEEVTALGISPIDPDVMFAGTITLTSGLDTVHVYRSDDAGGSWDEVDAGQSVATKVTDFAFDPVDPDVVYLANDFDGVYRTADGGETWAPARAAPNQEVEIAQTLVADPVHPGTLYVGLGSEIDPGGQDTLFKTVDGGDTWRPMTDGLPPHAPVRDLALSPDHPDRLVAATLFGPWVSTNAGSSWQRAGAGMPAWTTALAIDPGDPGTLFTGAEERGLLSSTDRGGSWSPIDTVPDVHAPLPPDRPTPTLPAPVHDLAFVPGTEPPVLLLATIGYRGGPGVPGPLRFGLLRSTDLGMTWDEANDGLPGTFVTRLLVAPTSGPAAAPTVYAIEASFGGGVIAASHDRGATWEVIFQPREGVQAMAVDPSDPSRLFAAVGGDSSRHKAIYRSRDSGATWTEVFTFPEEGTRAVSSLLVVPATAQGGGPAAPSAVLAGLGAPPPAHAAGTGVLFRSLDGGTTWELADDDLPRADPAPIGVTDLALDPDDPSVVWAATSGAGAYRSDDRGATWTPVSSGLGNRWIERLVPGTTSVDQSGPHGALYAATRGGVHRLDASAAGDPPPPAGPWIEDPIFPGFRVKVRITNQADTSLAGVREPACLPETICVSGALPGRSEVFVRIVGPKPNGYLWPTLVKLSTSTVEVWIERTSDGLLRYYELPGARPGVDELPGLFDRYGFPPEQEGF